jgi:hypothetical protein
MDISLLSMRLQTREVAYKDSDLQSWREPPDPVGSRETCPSCSAHDMLPYLSHARRIKKFSNASNQQQEPCKFNQGSIINIV